MNEAEWLACTDPLEMLALPEARSSERKLRLFLIACSRRVWHLLSPAYGRAVELAERFADGAASPEELVQTLKRANSRHNKAINQLRRARLAANLKGETFVVSLKTQAPFEAFQAVFYACSEPGLLQAHYHTFTGRYREGSYTVMRGADGAAQAVAYESTPDGESSINETALAAERLEQCRLLCDIIGNPFHTLTLSPAWLAWNDSIVLRLAQVAYDECILPPGTLNKTHLAVLADALEEAGCTDTEIIDHLRSPGPHVRGCFAVDLCLGLS